MSLLSTFGIPVWVLVISLTGVAVNADDPSAYVGLSDWRNYESKLKPSPPLIDWQPLDDSITLQISGQAQPRRGLYRSPQINDFGGDAACLTFSRHIIGGAKLYIYVTNDGTAQAPEGEAVWARMENFGEFAEAKVIIREELTTNFRIVINGTLNAPRRQSISVKDVEISKGRCTYGTYSASSTNGCDFDDNGFCGWQMSGSAVAKSGETLWTLQRNLQRWQFHNYRYYSRVLGSYASVNVQPDQWKDQSTVLLTSPELTAGDGCVRMFYRIQGGVNVGKFTISVKEGNSDPEDIFSLTGTQGIRWRQAVATIKALSAYNIIIGFTLGQDSGTVDIDEITITEGACEGYHFDADMDGKITCDLSEDKKDDCGLTSEEYFKSTFRKAEDMTEPTGGPVLIHSVEQKNPERTSTAFVTSQMIFTTSSRNCLTFSYFETGTNITSLFVATSADYFIGPRWFRRMNNTDGWRKGMVELEVSNNYQFNFHASIRPNATGFLALAEIQLTNSACPPDDNMCNFDQKDNPMCGWQNDPGNAVNHNWNVRTGKDTRATGPWKDHTTYTGTGSYIVADSSSLLKKGSTSTTRLNSKTFNPKDSDYCFTFWHNINGKKKGTLQVFVRSDDKDVLIWEKQKPTGPSFVFAEVNIPSSLTLKKSFQISFIANGPTNLNDIAIDEVNLEEGGCVSDKYAVPNPSFDNPQKR